MNRLKSRGLVVLALCVMAAGCSTELPVTPDATPIPTITEEFTGTLTINGAVPYPFTATTSGAVTLTVVSLSNSSGPAVVGPGGAIHIGLQLGIWNGTVCTVTTLSNDNSFVSTVLSAGVTNVGNLCARVYDVGALTEPASFDIRIEHP